MAGCCNYSRQPSRGVRMPVAEWLVVLVLVLLLQVSCLATVAVATAGGDETTDPRACPPDQCAHITCPADSRPLSTSHEHQHHHHRIDDDDDADIAAATSDADLLTGSSRRPPFVYISNNQQQHHHHLQQRHHQPRHIVDPVDDVHNNNSSTAAAVDDDVDDDDTTTDSRSGRAARSVRHFKRRITIVPVDHHTLHKRSASALDEHNDDQPVIFAEEDTASTPFNLTACCVRTHCTCDTTCVHNCEANEQAVIMRVASQRPGDCCDRIRCERKTCYSHAHRQHFEHGQRWSENDCTACECVDGEHKCQATMCRPLPCKHKVQVPGECCQRCDESRSQFCPGQTNCGLACRLGFVEDAERGGCKLCRCVRRKTTAATTTTTMTPTTAVTSVDATSDDAVSSSSSTTTTTVAVSIIDVERSTSMAPTSIEADVATSLVSTQSASVQSSSTDGTTTTTDRTTSNDDDDDTNGGYLWTAETNAPAAPSPPLTGSDPTDPTVMSIRSYFEEHHLYIIVSATVFTTATVFAGLVWTYCKFSNKNSYNIVPNA